MCGQHGEWHWSYLLNRGGDRGTLSSPWGTGSAKSFSQEREPDILVGKIAQLNNCQAKQSLPEPELAVLSVQQDQRNPGPPRMPLLHQDQEWGQRPRAKDTGLTQLSSSPLEGAKEKRAKESLREAQKRPAGAGHSRSPSLQLYPMKKQPSQQGRHMASPLLPGAPGRRTARWASSSSPELPKALTPAPIPVLPSPAITAGALTGSLCRKVKQ